MGKAAPNKRRLTENFVERVQPSDRAFLVWDAGFRGLALSVQPSGSKRWKVIYAYRRRARWYDLADATNISLADARKLAGRVMFQVAEGADPQALRRAERSTGTFEELADRYLEEHAKMRNRSWSQADALVRRFLRPRWGKLPASGISRSDVRAVMAKIESRATANYVLAAASAIFSWAIKQEVAGVMANPCREVERNLLASRDRVLAATELPAFWAAFDAAMPVHGAALKVLLLTGQRPGEVASMRRSHIIDGWWEMPGAPVLELGWPGTKNGQRHRVWLPPPVKDIIEALDIGEGFVFPGERRGAVKGLAGIMREVCRELGAERATPHDLRRTHGTTITGLGFGKDAMNRIQNHKEGGISSVYDRHQYADENKRIMEAVAGRILALATGTEDADNVARPTFKKAGKVD